MIRSMITRRDWLKVLGIGAAGSMLGGRRALGQVAGGGALQGVSKRSVRLAHITDVHVQPERGAGEGLAKCLRHLQGLKDAPALVVNTGDSIMDSMGKGAARTKLQWELWRKIMRDECSLPVEHAIGNHDIWGWNKTRSGTTGQEARHGKRWAMDELGLDRPYQSFDRFGWHFIVPDSTFPHEERYKAKLDEEQMAWLESDLRSADQARPVAVFSHIPIFSAAAVLNSASESAEMDLTVKGGQMHLDAKTIHGLFRQHGNVKLCLSGHLHILDRSEYEGVTYISSGAVSGAWWRGAHRERFDNGYAVVDLFEDGSFAYAYSTFGWSARPETPEEAAATAPVGAA